MINLHTISKHLHLHPLSRRGRRVVGTTLLLLGLAGLVHLFVMQLPDEERCPVGRQVEVVKAAREIPVGTPLTQDMVKSELVPEKFLPPNPVFKTDVSIYYGQPVAVKIAKDAMVLASDFTTAEVATTPHNKLPEGERALTIPASAFLGVSGLIRPGDRVDILSTFSDNSNMSAVKTGASPVHNTTRILLQNVAVLAVEKQPVSKGEEDKERGEPGNTVTLSVTVQEAILLRATQKEGKLMMLLRNPDDTRIVPVTKRTLKRVLEDVEVVAQLRIRRTRKTKKHSKNNDLKKTIAHD